MSDKSLLSEIELLTKILTSYARLIATTLYHQYHYLDEKHRDLIRLRWNDLMNFQVHGESDNEVYLRVTQIIDTEMRALSASSYGVETTISHLDHVYYVRIREL